MTTDSFKRVIYNNGEGLTFQDAIDAQDFMLAKIYDQIIANSIPAALTMSGFQDPDYGDQSSTNISTLWAYALKGGRACLIQGSATNKVRISQGTLLQRIAGAATGSAPITLAYTFDGSSTYEFTLTAGDATNPRVDLLQMSLAYLDGDLQSRDFEDATTRVLTTTSYNKKRQVACTLSVKAGTPAASPQMPEPDAGFVPVGCVIVGATYLTATQCILGIDTAGANAVVCDLRMPVGIKAYRVDPVTYKCTSNWALSAPNWIVLNSNVSNQLFVPAPVGPTGRLIGIGIAKSFTTTSGGTITLQNASGAGVTNNRNNVISLRNLVTAQLVDDIQIWTEMEQSHNPSAGATVTQSATNKYGIPIWGNGQRMPNSKNQTYNNGLFGTGGGGLDQLVLKFSNMPVTTNVGTVTFYVAEGW